MTSRIVSTSGSPQAPSTLLSLRKPDDLHWDMQPVQLAITRRAYELFRSRGCEHGHDWEDWFRAESELLRSVSVSMSESTDHISVLANVFGFGPKELEVAVETSQIIILGKKATPAAESAGKPEYTEPDQILKFIDLPKEVKPETAIVELRDGVLSFELTIAARQKIETATVAA